MSLEQAIADNTAALKELIAALKAQPPIGFTVPRVLTEKEQKAIASEESFAEDNVAREEMQKKRNAKKEVKTGVEPAPVTPKAEVVDYALVREVITDLAKYHRDHAVDMLKLYGASKGQDLAPEQYAEFILVARQKLADLKAQEEIA